RGQKQLRRRAMRILFKEVVLHRPAVIEANLVGQRGLLQRVFVNDPFGIMGPRPRHRQFKENSEFHCGGFPPCGETASRVSPRGITITFPQVRPKGSNRDSAPGVSIARLARYWVGATRGPALTCRATVG